MTNQEKPHEDDVGSNATELFGIGDSLVDQHSSVGCAGSLPIDDERVHGLAGKDVQPHVPGHQRVGAMRRIDNDDIPWVKKLPLTQERYAAQVLRYWIDDPDLTRAALATMEHRRHND